VLSSGLICLCFFLLGTISLVNRCFKNIKVKICGYLLILLSIPVIFAYGSGILVNVNRIRGNTKVSGGHNLGVRNQWRLLRSKQNGQTLFTVEQIKFSV
jgi:hypothetical protein